MSSPGGKRDIHVSVGRLPLDLGEYGFIETRHLQVEKTPPPNSHVDSDKSRAGLKQMWVPPDVSKLALREKAHHF